MNECVFVSSIFLYATVFECLAGLFSTCTKGSSSLHIELVKFKF